MPRSNMDVAFYWPEDGPVAMVAVSEEAKTLFKEKFEMPEDYDAIEVGEYHPTDLLSFMPNKFRFTNTVIKPNKIFKYLFYTQ